METLETKRLILRDWKAEDLDDLFAVLSNPSIAIPAGSSPVKTREKCKEVLDYLIAKKNNYAIEYKASGSVIGGIGLNEDSKKSEDTLNLGFYLAEDFWDQGLMTEALTAVIEYAKEITTRLSATHHNNPKTQHILEKFGFRQVDVIRNVKRKADSQAHDEPYYVLVL